jgi:heme-degrading monooxygenase HmoA
VTSNARRAGNVDPFCLSIRQSDNPGYLGFESAHEELGITISYWENEEAITAWKAQAEHLTAQQSGREAWYASYVVRVCKVERAYGFEIRI